MANRIAPIQVNYLGYPNTSGLAAMDYRITDAIADPPGMKEAQYTEQLVRLPRAFFAYLVPTGAPDVGPLPAAASGHVTFAVLTNFAKVRPAMMALWAQVLRAVPNSRLLIQAKSLNDAGVRAATEKIFAKHGVPAGRLELRGWVDFPEYLRLFAGIDVVLDTFPFAGHTTSCHALWMGAPLVTLAGSRHAARVGASLMAAVGLPELVAGTPEQYAAIAAGLAGDLTRLMRLRMGMRERLRASALCDEGRFMRNLETAYRLIWQRWCDRRRSDSRSTGG
jgi:predicted O-linked N-acetylglucosamine transferase (SPINDLY family)